MSKEVVRKKGFSFLSFFLGFLFGIILLVGAVVGVTLYAVNADLDKVLSMAGMDNGKDEDGKNKIINTDTENGGVKNVKELIGRVAEVFSDVDGVTLGGMEDLIPATGGMIDGLCNGLSEYIEVDRSELCALKLSEYGDYLQDKIYDIQPAVIMGYDDGSSTPANKFVEIMICGVEARYVTDGVNKYPVYYDVYLKNGETYLREGDDAELDGSLAGNLVEKNGKYRLYFFKYSDGNYYVTDGEYTFATPVARTANGTQYLVYTPEYAKLSGNYYYENGEKIVVDPITLRTLSEGGDAFDDVYMTEILTGSDDLTLKVMDGITVGDLVTGRVDVTETVNNLRLSDVLGDVTGNAVLEKLADSKIGNLSQDINALTVNELYASDIYPEHSEPYLVNADNFNPEYLYYEKVDGKLSLAGGNGHLDELPSGGEYYCYGKADGIWKILLYENDRETAYSINNLTAMIDNVSQNLSNSLLRDLHEAGILVFSNPENLEYGIQYYEDGVLKTTGPIGDMQLMEFINLVVNSVAQPIS